MPTVFINLTNDSKCFTYYLQREIETIDRIARDDYTTKQEFTEWLIELIKSAAYNKDAKPRFIHDIQVNCRTKRAVFDRCLRAISNAVEYQVA